MQFPHGDVGAVTHKADDELGSSQSQKNFLSAVKGEGKEGEKLRERERENEKKAGDFIALHRLLIQVTLRENDRQLIFNAPQTYDSKVNSEATLTQQKTPLTGQGDNSNRCDT